MMESMTKKCKDAAAAGGGTCNLKKSKSGNNFLDAPVKGAVRCLDKNLINSKYSVRSPTPRIWRGKSTKSFCKGEHIMSESTLSGGVLRSERTQDQSTSDRKALSDAGTFTVIRKEQCAKQGGCRQLTDVVRGSIIFEDEASMCTFITKVLL